MGAFLLFLISGIHRVVFKNSLIGRMDIAHEIIIRLHSPFILILTPIATTSAPSISIVGIVVVKSTKSSFIGSIAHSSHWIHRSHRWHTHRPRSHRPRSHRHHIAACIIAHIISIEIVRWTRPVVRWHISHVEWWRIETIGRTRPVVGWHITERRCQVQIQ